MPYPLAVFALLLVCCGGAGSAPDAGGDAGSGADAGGDAGRDADLPDPDPACCNPVTGLPGPLRVCSPEDPCVRPGEELVKQGITELTEPTAVPDCRTTASDRPVFDDNPPLQLDGVDGTPRYFCVHEPAGTEARPLVVFLHGGVSGRADNVYNNTLLRQKAAGFELAGETGPAGFVLASVQGRALHYPTAWNRDGNHHDFYYRDLASPSTNPDVANLDRLIDHLVGRGSVDPDRIYLMGWSNGAFFSQMYGIARHSVPTPGGNRVAAIAVFSGGDPFDDINPDEKPPCRLDPYPASSLPVFHARRDCDAGLACSVEQAGWFDTPPGHCTELWLQRARERVGITDIAGVIVDGRGRETDSCASSLEECTDVTGIRLVAGCPDNLEDCALIGGLLNHVRWPDGVADASGNDYEPRMLGFLRDNPLE